MPGRSTEHPLHGFKLFRERFFSGEASIYKGLSSAGQKPKTLVIGCSDSRADPAILSAAGPGELFVVRNIANLVPPCETDRAHHGVSAAIEFAVVNLQVENVVVLGHRQCGGIGALLFPGPTQAGGFVRQWMNIAEPAKARAISKAGTVDQKALWRRCELESIRVSLENLRTFPFVRQAIQERGLVLMGVYFDLENGDLLELDDKTGEFRPVQL